MARLQKIFKIVPKKVSLTKATNIKGKKVKLGWKKVSGISGYEIQYGINKSFKKAKTTTAKSSLKTKTIKKLKNKKKYYFRMRAYKKVSGTKVYGVYSSKKTVKITK